MAFNFDPGALLGASFPLADGTRVRLRLARRSDAPAIRELLRSAGGPGAALQDLDVARLVHADPRRCCVMCAMALIAGRETLVGIGVRTITDESEEPELVVVDRELAAGVDGLLTAALGGRAAAIGRMRAA